MLNKKNTVLGECLVLESGPKRFINKKHVVVSQRIEHSPHSEVRNV
jgi:hypothetical protein